MEYAQCDVYFDNNNTNLFYFLVQQNFQLEFAKKESI